MSGATNPGASRSSVAGTPTADVTTSSVSGGAVSSSGSSVSGGALSSAAASLFSTTGVSATGTASANSVSTDPGALQGTDFDWNGSVLSTSFTPAQTTTTTSGVASAQTRFTKDDLSGESAPYTFLSATSGFDRDSVLGGTVSVSTATLDTIFADQSAALSALSDRSATLDAITAYRDQDYFTATNTAASQSGAVSLTVAGDTVTLTGGTVVSSGAIAISATTLNASGVQGSASRVSVTTATGDLSLSTFSDISTDSMALEANGGDVLIDVSRDFSGDFTAIAGNDIRQIGTSITAQNIVYSAANDIIISAETSSVTSDIVATQISSNPRWTRDGDEDRHIVTQVVVGSQTVATATAASVSASGTLQIIAGNDVDVTGSTLSGEDGVLIVAGNELNILPETLTNSSSQKVGKTSSSSTVVSNVLSSVTSGGDLTLAAGLVFDSDGSLVAGSGAGDLTVAGAALTAEGTLSLLATGTVTVAAATDIAISESQSKKSSLFKKTTKVTSSTDITHIGSTLSGSDVKISGTDITLAGADIDATGSIGLSASGTILSGAYADVHESYSHKSSSWLGGLINNYSTTSQYSTELSGSDLLADADLSMVTATGDITLQGGSYTARTGTLTISPGSGKLVLSALVDSDQGYSQSQSDNGVTRTLTTESWDRESAAYALLSGAQTDLKGVTGLTGTSVRAGTDSDGAVTLSSSEGIAGTAASVGAWIDTLPDDLQGKAAALAVQGLTDAYSYDSTTSMNPAFGALVAIAASFAVGPGGWLNLDLTGWQAAVTSSAITSATEVALTGNFDLDDIIT
ncbi:beta strand repeat-containing protein, partial [Paenirhodobacter enshiensis]|uniref:beta strand repeat-containing protein n=1 Tax=Paenirhodobacter enshiensis TaxID=1105367 RepID=UPI001268CEB6